VGHWEEGGFGSGNDIVAAVGLYVLKALLERSQDGVDGADRLCECVRGVSR